MRKLFIISLLSLLCFGQSSSLFAQERFIDKLEFGVEWGYSQNIYNKFKYTIQSAAEGYRLKESGSRFYLFPHLRFNLRCSYHINEKISASFVAGMTGIGENTQIFPLLLRFNYFNKTKKSDSLFSYIDLGYGLRKPSGFIEDEAFLLDFGEGYRLVLASRCSLDFILQLSYAYNRPQIPNPDGPGFLSSHYVLSNYSENFALSLMMSFNF